MKLKLLSHQKVINSLLLNFLGFQALRYSISKILYLTKKIFIKKKNLLNIISKEVIDKGFAKEENSLSLHEFESIKKEFDLAINDPDVVVEKESYKNPEITNGIEHKTLMIDENIKDKYPSIFNFKNSQKIKSIFSCCEMRENIKIYCRLERINVFNNQIKDDNKEYHYDTFHNTFKAWLFLSDVNEKDGPYCYIPNSNKFSLTRFFSEWKNSIIFALKKNFEPSFRVKSKFKKKLDLKSFKAIVPKNTLVVSNTHGLHRRGDAQDGTVRESIHFWTRENPFKIFLD